MYVFARHVVALLELLRRISGERRVRNDPRRAQLRKEKTTMLNRREMIQRAMAFSAWPAIRPLATTQRITGSGPPDDEVFWASVRSQFELAPESVNLVSVVRGNFTTANREIAFSEATRMNRLAAPLFLEHALSRTSSVLSKKFRRVDR